ncbi:hypothetical protein SDC9_144060 [bioreactor metagenome]|uniref:Uncharacterized protein n=1 Tax=bioreactor metagenome TaxID=1076179 RepID=A0A645E525_9ZZZZ
MLVGSPLGKAGEEFPHLFTIGMKDVWPVAVHQNTMHVSLVKCIATNVGTAINNLNTLAGFSKRSGDGTTGKTCTDDKNTSGGHLILQNSCRLPLMPSKPSTKPARKACNCASLPGSLRRAPSIRTSEPGTVCVNRRMP